LKMLPHYKCKELKGVFQLVEWFLIFIKKHRGSYLA
jgi:hypothetical protein